MKKNKLITLILVSAVCFSLILSLCSFTTSNLTNQEIYEGLGYTIDVGYFAQRQNISGSYEYFYGYIPSFNRIYSNSPERYACDYQINGTNVLSYTDVAFVPSSGYSDVTLATTNSSFGYLNGKVQINGFFNLEDISRLQISFESTDDIMYDFSNASITCSITSYYINYEDYFYGFLEPLSLDLNGDFSVSGSPFYLDVSKLIDKYYQVYELSDNISLDSLLIYSIKFEIIDSSSFNYVQVKDYLYDELSRSSHFSYFLDLIEGIGVTQGESSANEDIYNEGYDTGYTEGYLEGEEVGFNQGVSQAPSIWGGLGQFLTTSVGAFLDFEFFNGFTVSNVLALIVSVGVVIVFLKIFAGG